MKKPRYFAKMKKLNKVDCPLLMEVRTTRTLSVDDLKNALNAGMTVIDTRPKNKFAKSFIPGTINTQGNNVFNTRMGRLVSYETSCSLDVAGSCNSAQT